MKYEPVNLTISSSPHAHSKNSTAVIMRDVCIALLPALIAAGAQMVDRMAMRRNEWRDWAGLPPDAEMEELLALENYIPASRLGDQKKLNGQTGGREKDDGNADG